MLCLIDKCVGRVVVVSICANETPWSSMVHGFHRRIASDGGGAWSKVLSRLRRKLK